MNQHFPVAPASPAPPRTGARAGMSLVEVMCALIVIVVALLTAIGQMQVVNGTATSATDQARVQEIGHALLDRIVGANPVDLGTSTLIWTQPRYEDGSIGQPLIEGGPAINNIQQQQLIQQRSGLSNLRIFVEYYRGLQEPNGAGVVPGVMDATFANAHDFTVKFQDPVWRAARTLNVAAPPLITQVSPENPIVIRLILTWDPGQRLELYTVKRRPTS